MIGSRSEWLLFVCLRLDDGWDCVRCTAMVAMTMNVRSAWVFIGIGIAFWVWVWVWATYGT